MEKIVDEHGYPLPGFLDLFTRRDELELAILKELQAIGLSLGGGVASPGQGPPSGGLINIAGVELRRVTLFDHLRPYETSITYYPPGGTAKVADCGQARESVLVVVQSTCNQALTVQAIGSLSEQADDVSAFAIGAGQALGITSSVGLGIDLSVNWYPYLGCSVASGATPPTAGDVSAWAFVRRFR